ncbi:MAG TPA: hypothetical protein VK049_06285 [Paenalcaligenes sp.]|nr:hypothetical protein [Paenalcaligenes sp.]
MLAGLMACANPPDERGNPKGESMSFDQLAQTDFNRTVTIAMRDNLDTIYRLREKLYRRNPIQWQRGGFQSMQEAIEASQHSIENAQPPEYLAGLHDIEILSVSLSDDFTGDRVGAFIFGLADMILTAHNNKSRFYIADQLNAQHIFNAARNVEIAAWLLNNRRGANGEPLLFANEMSPQGVNLSFEREFGQLIGRLDLIANLLDENLRRVGIGYVQGLLFFSFLPVR